jgi:sigma-B regulation protein RsbU (phosphoserine phosphatase)
VSTITPTPSSPTTTQTAAAIIAGAGSISAAGLAGNLPPRLSITDFLTDGSLASMCSELCALTGLRVELQDPLGRTVHKLDTPDASGKLWAVSPAPSDVRGPGVRTVPLDVGGEPIGHIAIAAGDPKLGSNARHHLERAIAFLAAGASEICSHELELRTRMKELSAVARMSSLLSRAANPKRVLEVALELVLDVLSLDAGSIMLVRAGARRERLIASELAAHLDPHEEDLELAVSRNLSQDWLDLPVPLSKDRLFDREAMLVRPDQAGQVVISEDLLHDDRILIPDRAREEGLGAAIHAGMVFSGRPLGVIRAYSRTPRTFDEADRKLMASIASQAAAALEQSRLLQLEREEQQLQRQLSLAADVQRRMLPRGVPNFPSLDVAARYIPSHDLGGDFYDFFDLSGHLGIVVGDVVGKGIAAALLMSSVRASLRAYAQDLYHLDEVVSRVNHALARDTRDHEFASLWYGIIDPATMRLTYCSAGHESPLVVRVPKHRAPTLADLDELSVGGMVVGIDPSQRYQRALFDVRPGDVLLAYTDGVPDATNAGGERFGKARTREALLLALRERPNASAGEVVERVLRELRQFTGGSQNGRGDDITLVCVRVR